MARKIIGGLFGGGKKKKTVVAQPAAESAKWKPIVSQLGANDPNKLRILNKGGGRPASSGPNGPSLGSGGGTLGSGGGVGGTIMGILRKRGGGY